MKCVTLIAGAVAGMAVAAAAVTTMYPDVSRRFMRDARHMWRCSKRAVMKMGHGMN